MKPFDPSLRDQIDAMVSLDELEALLTREARRFGLTAFAMGSLSDSATGNRMYLCTWPPAWTELYAVNGFAAEDVVVDEAKLTPVPFTWTELKLRRPGAAARIYAAAAEFDWSDGFVVPVHGPEGERGIVAFVARRLDLSARDRTDAAALALWSYRRAEFLYNHRGKQAVLSERERDALALVAQGKDDGDIGLALGVSRTTAHAHVERAKRRLGASTRAQAVALAVARRLI
jgi:DNA-binding CsgD family transcriptional regulator